MTKHGDNKRDEQDERDERGFKVTDRRAFTADGELRDEDTEVVVSTEPVPAPQAPPIPEPAAGEPRVAVASAPNETREVGFPDLVSMLATQALLALGDLPSPSGDESKEDLASAQIMICFLEVLGAKTAGNLSEDEAKVLDDVLYDLRMRFMKKANLIKY